MLKPIPITPGRPKWTARQRIGAADLTAEQVWQDQQLNRLRRMALGWGVITGFSVAQGDGAIRLGRGYGLTAAGSEVYVPEDVVIEGVAKEICDACGTGGGCSVIDPQTGAEAPITAWLVLRPEPTEGCARPTVPEGCVHPGSAFAYARMGVALVPEIMCALDPALTRPEPDCDTARSYLEDALVPWPAPETDILPIAEVTCDDGVLTGLSTLRRRKLLPLGALQDIVACCECDAAEPLVDDPVDPGEGPTDPPPVRPWDAPADHDLGELIADIFGALSDPALKTLTVGEVFAVDEDPRLITGRARAAEASAQAQAFVASVFVATETGLEAYRRQDWAAVLGEATGEQGGLGGRTGIGFGRAGRSAAWFDGMDRAQITALTVREAVRAGFAGYDDLSAALGEQSAQQWIGKPVAGIEAQVDELSLAARAAALWLFFRLNAEAPR